MTDQQRSQGGIGTADIASAGTEYRDQTDTVQADKNQNVAGPAASSSAVASAPAGVSQTGPLFPSDDAQNYRERWSDIQATFVDDPRQAVQQADELVADVMKRLATMFADERTKLEQQWDRGDDVSTEDLRVALQRYRSFFVRLLAI